MFPTNAPARITVGIGEERATALAALPDRQRPEGPGTFPVEPGVDLVVRTTEHGDRYDLRGPGSRVLELSRTPR